MRRALLFPLTFTVFALLLLAMLVEEGAAFVGLRLEALFDFLLGAGRQRRADP